MSYEDIRYKYGVIERRLTFLEPHEMTAKELRQALKEEHEKIVRNFESISRAQGRIASIKAQISRPLMAIPGAGKTTPRKKICRIHEWDALTNRRIRGHKHDWRMPSFKGNETKEIEKIHI
jgi:hypothetical protein